MEVFEVFDRHAKKYDEERRRLIPGFDDFYGLAIDVMDFKHDNPRVLDLGAGTGLLTKFLLEKYPNSKVTLIDLSKNMLNEAKSRFKYNSNINYLNEDYMTYQFSEKFDIIMSSLSIHHLTQEEKEALYNKYVNLLNDDGIFVNADLIRDTNNEVEKFFYKKCDELILKNVNKKEFEEANQRRKFDDTDYIGFQLNCLKNAGCRLVGVPFKFYTHAVLWGKK